MTCLNATTNGILDKSNEFRIALFGPQVTDWTYDSLSNLQSTLLADVNLEFLRQALATLPSLWPLLGEGDGSHGLLGQEKLKELRDFATGARKLDPQALTNTHLSVLTVVAQVVNLIGSTDAFCTKHGILRFEAAQGLCVGFLSAAALASAHDWTNVEINFSNAIRLAACVGAAIDTENTLRPDHERATAVHVRWKMPKDRAYFETCLDQLSGAYVSCITDDRDITITLPKTREAEFCLRMREAKIAATPFGLSGRYHHSSNAKVAEKLSQLCAENRGLRLPNAENLRLPLRSTSDANLINEGALHDIAIQTILCKRAHWFQTVKLTLGDAPQSEVALVPFGNVSSVPRSLSPEKNRMTTALDPDGGTSREEIAVIGMACRYPKANNLEEFRQLLWAGGSAISKMPPERFNPAGLDRQPKLASFWGNFLHNPEAFDHRFFNISGREAKSMDPQQRLALQVAYEALESSGYCSKAPVNGVDVGCYLGVGSVDYDENVASHDANAFAATGTLRAFISGRISHFFGWSGPSLTFDTACSSSVVAIHTASKALLGGECSMALAGGVNVITSPTLHQNLSAASFLNPNGASRAFDAEANGYCRGEGAGILVLKTLSRAKADGDTILGIVAASAVNQGTNMTNITVPDSDSQSSLYNKVLSAARIEPKEVTYVEAHGTGTPVGDPIEYESVRLALVGPRRGDQVLLGSVKDNIGHTEAASGVAGVIKALLMMQYRTIPKQANFKSLNPRIKASASIIVPQTTRSWTAQHRVALVNNYGAAGSNAALVLRDYPDTPSITTGRGIQATAPLPACVSPILLSAKTADGLQSYVNVLKSYLPTLQTSVESVAYNLARSHNSSFKHRAAFVAADVQSAISSLDSSYALTDKSAISSPKRHVVLCFGGQTSRKIRVSKDLYERCDLFRTHLDACDLVCQTLGLNSIYPDIFLGDDIDDIVSLHCMLLSLQVTCAKCWIDCGLEVDTMVGHSFGQLTALCIADCISLKDAFFFVSSRARLIRDNWGVECGSMLSVECDKGELEAVVHLVNSMSGLRLDVACYNGPRSFVLAGDEPSIEKAEKECRSFKTTRLRNSHAYHSCLTNDILEPLAGVAKLITIRPPRIRIETCSPGRTWSEFNAEKFVQHTREPVHFADAIERIASHLPSAIWLEAGSSSPVIPMTRRLIASKSGRMDIFVPIDIGNADAATHLAKIACQLWIAGSVTQHWLFHNSSRHQYTKLNLPPYQFDKSGHWVQYKPRYGPKVKETTDLVNVLVNDSAPAGEHLFAVDTANAEFELAARGHAVAGQSLCPASMYIELAARCVMDLQSTNDTGNRHILPHVEGLRMSAPLGLGKGTAVFLRLKETDPTIWEFAVVSRLSSSGVTKSIAHSETEHARGRISSIGGSETQTQRLLKLLQRSSIYHAQNSASATGVTGSMVYKLFSDVVEYASYYRGVRSVSACGTEAIGLVSTPTDKISSFNASICDFISLDNFLQVAGIHVNCLSPRDNDQVFICTAVEEILFSSTFMTNRDGSRAWTVTTRYEPKSLVEVTNNILVCDSLSGDLVLAIIGARFKGIPFKSVARSLSKLNKGHTNSDTTPKVQADDSDNSYDSAYQTGTPSPSDDMREPEVSMQTKSPVREMAPKIYPPQTISTEPEQESQPTTSSALMPLVSSMFSAILEVPLQEIKPTATLGDLGIDSLLVTEVLSEIKTRFSISLEQAQLMTCPNVASVASLIQGTRTPPMHQKPIETTHISKDHIINGENFTNGDNLTNRHNLTNGDRLNNGHIATDGTDFIEADGISNGDRLSNGDVYTNGHKFMDSYALEAPKEESQQIFTNNHEDRLPQETNANLAVVGCDCFVDANTSYDQYATFTGFAGFCGNAFSLQSKLVVQYVVEAFASLGCPLRALKSGEEVPPIRFEARHKKLIPQLYKILCDADLVTEGTGSQFLRTKKSISTIPTSALLDEMLKIFPKHASETRLLHTTAHRLADCLSGVADPLALLFRDAKARTLLEDVYTNAPMFKTGTLVLAQYLLKVLSRVGASRELKILELGAGTGGTSKQLIETLAELGRGYKFSYTFTDLSSSLVAGARRKFSKWPFMHYTVLDIENEPDSQFMGAYDIIISTNCIHATKSLVQSCTNIRKMLRADGVLCLVELTRNLYWFDLVFGLLEGWWLFNDGREHALADEQRWKRCLLASGFEWIDWTRSPAAESDILRVITASPYRSAPLDKDVGVSQDKISQRNGSSDHSILKETVIFKEVDGLSLSADIYYPSEVVESKEKLPVALMIHGGGHIMLSRNDVRPEQTSKLLQSGFVPISIDYRLCPETTLLEGPMTDVADALLWIRTILPTLTLSRRDIRVDSDKVVAVGWSTGGHLAMTLAWTSAARHIQPPEAILAFYCPTDYEDPFWTTPNIPIGAPQTTDMNMMTKASPSDNDRQTIFEGTFDAPVLAYNIPPKQSALGGWLAPSDARSRLALYMNTHGRTLQVLLGGPSAPNSNSKSRKESLIDDQEQQAPPRERIIAASPLAQIRAGNYAAVPTFLIHPRKDDLIPWQQAERTWQALRDRGGADAELRIVEDVPHLFDMYPRYYRGNQAAMEATEEGYRFLCRHVAVEWRGEVE